MLKKGGTLIIEQPEMHVGPPKQPRLIESLQSVAYERKIDLILNTCSDYIVRVVRSSQQQKNKTVGFRPVLF